MMRTATFSPAWQPKVARAKLYNGPICDVFNNTDSPDGTNRRQRCGNYLQAILDAETVDELSEDVDEAKETASRSGRGSDPRAEGLSVRRQPRTADRQPRRYRSRVVPDQD